MNMFDDHCHRFNQTILRILGLWPYGKTKFDRFRARCFFILLVSFMFAQLSQFAIVVDFNINVIIKILSDVLPAILYVVKFTIFFFETKKLKKMLREMMNNRRMLTDAQEIKIIELYARQGKNIAVIFTFLILIMILVAGTLSLLPEILDFFWPLNESRPHYSLFLNEYHIDEGVQFYSIFLYSGISTVIGVVSMTSISMLLLRISLHCCALYKICSCRIKQSVDKKVIACSNSQDIIVKRIIKTVELHRNAHRLFKLFISSYTITFLVYLVVGTFSLIVSLYRLLYVITCMDNLIDLTKAISYIGGHELYIFGVSLAGQLMVNHADDLFQGVYMTLWYEAPVSVRKMLLFIMQISLKSIEPGIGGIYISVMTSFTSISSRAISIMMVLYSLQ